MTEIETKLQRLGEFLDRHHLDGVYLQRRNNFAWITCGCDNHILNASPDGVAGILATRDAKRVCFTNNIESPRFEQQELAGLGMEVVSHAWFDSDDANRKLTDLIAGRKVAADVSDWPTLMTSLPADFAALRWTLTDQEIDRYRIAGQHASKAIEQACRDIKPGFDGHEIAGVLDHYVRRQWLNPVVTLVAVDESIESFRHPLPKHGRLRRYAMLVSCAEYGGLIANVTRFVHFGPMSAELKRKHQAVCDVDAAINLSTAPGKTLGHLFNVIEERYAASGFPGEHKLHHQGGSTGYAAREVIAVPGSDVVVLDRQAFAWNPSIAGTKSEDTVLCTTDGIEVLTKHSDDWPTVVGRFGDRTLDRADMLCL